MSGAVDQLVQNWTSDEFVRFVDQLGDIAETVVGDEQAGWNAAARIWERVLELEAGFWPSGDELPEPSAGPMP